MSVTSEQHNSPGPFRRVGRSKNETCKESDRMGLSETSLNHGSSISDMTSQDQSCLRLVREGGPNFSRGKVNDAVYGPQAPRP
jgi:hypothetical protein